jgi:hypothetical protein
MRSRLISIALAVVGRLALGALAALVSWVVCETMLRAPGVAGYAPAELVTVACGVAVVLVVLFREPLHCAAPSVVEGVDSMSCSAAPLPTEGRHD